MGRVKRTVQTPLSNEYEGTKMYHEPFLKCNFRIYTIVNRFCKGREFESKMYDTPLGKVCVFCYGYAKRMA